MIIKIYHDTKRPHELSIQDTITLDLPNSGPTTIHASKNKPFWWNGANSPRICYSIIPPHKFPLMHMFHDHLCEQAETPEERKNADKDFLWIGQYIYKMAWRVKAGYIGARIGSWFPLIVKLFDRSKKG